MTSFLVIREMRFLYLLDIFLIFYENFWYLNEAAYLTNSIYYTKWVKYIKALNIKVKTKKVLKQK